MKKRLLATFLWFNTGWYAGAMLAEILGWSFALGPILGVAVAGLIFADPMHVIWKDRVKATAPMPKGMPEPA